MFPKYVFLKLRVYLQNSQSPPMESWNSQVFKWHWVPCWFEELQCFASSCFSFKDLHYVGFMDWMTVFKQLGDQEREKTAAWGMWRFVWHVFPICSRLSIWGGILSMPTANCKLYLFNQIGKFKGEKKEDVPRRLGFHDPWWLRFWGILESLWFLSHRRIPVDFIGKVVFLSLQRG